MLIMKLKSDAADSGNAMTQWYENVCKCDKCGKRYSFDEGELGAFDLCPECDLEETRKEDLRGLTPQDRRDIKNHFHTLGEDGQP